MLDGNAVAVLVRNALRADSPLVTLLGGVDKINVFDEVEINDVDIFEAIAQLALGTVTVDWRGFRLPAGSSYIHQVALYVRPPQGQKPSTLLQAIVNAIQTDQLSNDLLCVEFPQAGRRTVLIGEDSRFTYWETEVLLQESGML